MLDNKILYSKRRTDIKAIVLMAFYAVFLLIAIYPSIAFAARVSVVPSSLSLSPGDTFYVDVMVDNIPAEGLGAVQFKLNVNAQGTTVSGISDISQGKSTEVSVATPILIGQPTSSRSGIGDFFLSAKGPNGILVMDNDILTVGTGMYTFGHTSGSVSPSGGGSVARFVFEVGKDVAAQQITISLSEVMLLDDGTQYSLDSNTGATIALRCITKVPNLLGLSMSDAQTALQNAGLLVGNISELNNWAGVYALNKVLTQSMTAGTTAFCQSPVDFAINIPPAEVGNVGVSFKRADESGTVVLSWIPSVSADTSGYRVYFIGDQQQNLLKDINLSASTGVEISGLPYGRASQLKITAYNNYGNESQGVTVSATPGDDVPPIGSISITNGAYANNAAITLSLSATDGGSGVSKMCISNTPVCTAWEDYATVRTWTLSSGDGPKIVYVWYQDKSGNINATPHSASIALDTTAPALTVSALSDGSWTNNEVLNIAGTATDNIGIQQFTINGITVQLNTDGTFSYPAVLQDGPNIFTVIAEDYAGNRSSDTRTISLDRQAPVINIFTPADNMITKSSPIDLNGAVAKTSTVTISLNGADPVPAVMSDNNFSLPITPVYGINTIEVSVTDRAGNTSAAKRTITFDDRSPVLAVTNPGQDIKTNQSGMIITGEVEDLTAITVTLTLDGNTYTPAVTNGTFAQPVTFTSGKTYQIYVNAVDEAGNVSTVQRNIVYDITAPSVTIDQVTSITNLSSQTLTGTMEAGATVSVACSTATLSAVTYPTPTTWTVVLSNMREGNNVITVTAADAAGNMSAPVSAAISVDLTAPAAVITSPLNGGAYSSEVSIAATATDSASGVATVEYQIDNRGWISLPLEDQSTFSYSTTWTLTSADEGSRLIRVRATDKVGNQSQLVSTTIIIDNTPPVVTATPAGGIISAGTAVALAANETADIHYTTDGSTPDVNSPLYSSPIIVAGNTTLKFFALDRAGNQSAIITANYSTTSDFSVNVTTSKGRQLSGLAVYAFSAAGSYTGVSATTGSGGNAAFKGSNFISGSYKFRVDYLGYQFWSDTVAIPGNSIINVTIQEEMAEVALTPVLASINVYLFNSDGSYLNQSVVTNSGSKADFILPVGKDYKFRADNLGYQYWSSVATITGGGTNSIPINLGGGLFNITLQKEASMPLAGVSTYLFSQSGSQYLGLSRTTASNGLAGYSVTSGSFKVRADYLGYQFWTDATNVTSDTNVTLNIPHRINAVTVNGLFQGINTPLSGITAYLFDQSGNYLNISKITDSNGVASFELPQKAYKVRADYLGMQFWSPAFTFQDAVVSIPMADAKITVTGNGLPLSGVPVYVFTSSGLYLNVSGVTDSSGSKTFRLPAGSYKFRADYQAKQFWTPVETLPADVATPVSISTGGGSFVLKVMQSATLPLTGVRCYVFNEGGPYLNLSGVTDSQGLTTFDLADGNYQFRVDYLGYQFWTSLVTVPQTLKLTDTIDHRNTIITVDGRTGSDMQPIVGVPVYLFTPSGSYLSVNNITDSSGTAAFVLPQEPYQVRVDYLGQQFWSPAFTWQDTNVVIPVGVAQVHVSMTGQDIAGETVYVFDASGNYMGVSGLTDPTGLVEFRLPVGSYKFRADYQGQQFWISAGVIEAIQYVEIKSDGATFVFNVNTGSAPLAGVSVYVFDGNGPYLNIYGTTDNSGQVTFKLVDGNFKFRADYLGYQYWSDVAGVPGTVSRSLTIPHKNLTITVQGLIDAQTQPLSGLPVYLFTPAGSYLSIQRTTDNNGEAMFFMPDADYKVRVDYLGENFWSDTFRFVDTTVTISEGNAHLSITRSGISVSDAIIYLFSAEGAYLGLFKSTDSTGSTDFILPVGVFKFRIDEGGKQYWSDLINLQTGQPNEIGIDVDSANP